MTPFIIIIPLLLFMSIIGANATLACNNKTNHIKEDKSISPTFVTVGFIIFLWLLTAFRSSDIGNDTKNYIYVFYRISREGIIDSLYMEKGYQYLNYYIIRIFGANPQMLLIICASISYLCVGIYVIKCSKNYYLSTCFLFCFVFSCFTNTIRQGLAMVIGIMAYIYFCKGKKVIPILLIVCAMSIHYTAFILFALFLYHYVPRKFSTVLIISGVLLLLSISGLLNQIFIAILPRGQNYFQSERVGSGYLALSYELIRDATFCFFAYSAYNDDKNDDSLRRLIVFVVCFFVSCISFNMNLIGRANGYFLILQIVELPNVFMNMKSPKKNVYAFLSCMIMLTYFMIVQIYRPEWNHLYPYKFWSD